jgi:MraZ protein
MKVEENIIYLHLQSGIMSSATSLLGEFECRIDEKNRIIFPSRLKKQLPPSAEGKFTIINGIDPCLEMYPQNEWDLIVERINKLDLFNIENREFVHHYYRGMSSTELDSQNRVLLPKAQFSHAGIDREIILFAFANRIEIWDKETFNKRFSTKPVDFPQMAQRVMGTKQNSE